LDQNGQITNRNAILEQAAQKMGAESEEFAKFEEDLQAYEEAIDQTLDDKEQVIELRYQELDTIYEGIDVAVNFEIDERAF
jgi:hypothetical protein